MKNNFPIDIAKKEIEKAIINELYKKSMINFFQYISIIKTIDEEINKLKNKFEESPNMTNLVVKIPI